MFTGLIETVGTVENITAIDGGIRLWIAADVITEDLSIGDSISVNGVCLTAVGLEGNHFAVEAVGETLEKTTIGGLAVKSPVNLERAMSGNKRFGGHFVQGHVNDTGEVLRWDRRGDNYFLEIEVAPSLKPYIVLEGSIAIDGISLTVATLQGQKVGINIIPHTTSATHLQFCQPGQSVNIEVDMIAKYVESFVVHYAKSKSGESIYGK